MFWFLWVFTKENWTNIYQVVCVCVCVVLEAEKLF